MGAGASSNPVRVLDKRSCRRRYSSTFAGGIAGWRPPAAPDALGNAASSAARLRLSIRVRPITEAELGGGEFDVVTVHPDAMGLTVHDARMHSDMQRQLLIHRGFEFDAVFGAASTTPQVYERSGAAATVRAVATAEVGSAAAVLVFGQTGSGKTFTMEGMHKSVAADVFAPGTLAAERGVRLSLLEITDVEVRDLLAEGGGQVQLVDGVAVGCIEGSVRSPVELLALLQFGLAGRATDATGVHDASSRSHAVLLLHIPVPRGEVLLVLADLAGTEMAIDSAVGQPAAPFPVSRPSLTLPPAPSTTLRSRPEKEQQSTPRCPRSRDASGRC